MKKAIKTKVIFVRLTDEEHDNIVMLAEQERRSIASVARQAIKEFLEWKKGETSYGKTKQPHKS